MRFVEVLTGDREPSTIHIDDISCIKSHKVNISQASNAQVQGCIIERRSRPEYAIWCIEPKDLVESRMLHAGAIIEGSGQ